jgi:hypothetical protein
MRLDPERDDLELVDENGERLSWEMMVREEKKARTDAQSAIEELHAVRVIVDRATTQCGLGAAIAEHFGADLPRTD